MKKAPRYIKAVLFDFDGTLTRPESLDLKLIKREIGCPADGFLLEYIENLPSPAHRRKALAAVDRFELAAAAKAEPNPGAEDLVRFLRSKDLRLGILTRNSAQSVRRALQNFTRIDAGDFDQIIARDEPIRPKPSGDGVRLAARRFGLPVDEVLMVGDFPIDIEAGKRAGALTALLESRRPVDGSGSRSDFTVARLSDIKNIVRQGLPLAAGKLPNDLLALYLSQFNFDDPSVLIKPGIGEDIAAVDVRNEEILVLKSDPITFATDAIGRYAVAVNANDVATAGAVPLWFLATLLFPVGTSAFMVGHVMAELNRACRSLNITLCGGHTEITDTVNQPVVTGMMAGCVTQSRLIEKRNVKTGDRLLLTKAVAVEGTAIIAREFGDRLVKIGVPAADVSKCRRFLDYISVLPEAAVAGGVSGVSAMHDVTEGGLASAVKELSIAAGHRIRIDMDKIPIFPETTKFCGLLKLDPLGLIGSGSLLICCRRYAGDELIQKVKATGTAVEVIGEVREAGNGVEAFHRRQPVSWPDFEVDEITRLY